ncbi:MAG: DUF3987 domain-containing protein [Nitrospinae bacterium]|nr:DUF3987 domain-containing protein [Nitrospinota bacterium]
MPRHFPNWLRAYAEHTAISEAPKAFHFWTGVSVVAGALQRKVWLDQRIFQWSPNFYIVFVGPPGVVTKSTSMKIGYRILRRVPKVVFGPQSMTWQGLLRAFSESFSSFPYNGLQEVQSAITCDVSELGTFLKPSDQEMMDFLTDAWDGQKGTFKRGLKHEEDTVIENAWLNIIGCTTPSWLRDNFPSSMIFGGLASRCVFVWGTEKQEYISYPDELIEQKDFQRREEMLFDDLVDISNLIGPFEIAPEARIWGRDWYKHHWTNRPDHLSSERFDGYMARKQTHIHKLAMVLTAAAGNNLVIQRDTLELADAAMTGLELDMINVFDSIGTTDAAKHIDEVMSLVRTARSITQKNLWRRCMRHMDRKEFDDALQACIIAGYLGVRTHGADVYVTLIEQTKGK